MCVGEETGKLQVGGGGTDTGKHSLCPAHTCHHAAGQSCTHMPLSLLPLTLPLPPRQACGLLLLYHGTWTAPGLSYLAITSMVLGQLLPPLLL